MRDVIMNLADLRKKRRLTQKQVAMLTGIPLPILRMMERGEIIPDKEDPHFVSLCQLFDIPYTLQ